MLVRRNSDTPYQELGARSKATPPVLPTALSASQTSTISSSPPTTTMATATVTNGGNVSRVNTVDSSSDNTGSEGRLSGSGTAKEPSRVSLSISRLLPLITREGGRRNDNESGSGGTSSTRNIDQTIHGNGDGSHGGSAATGNNRQERENREQHRNESQSNSANRDEEAVWQEDSGVKACPLCETKFTFFNRRHHCRKCGKIFCNKCCGKFCTFIPGSSVVEPEEEGGRTIVRNEYQYYKFRTCDKCYDEIKMLKEALGIVDDSEEDSRDEEESEEEEETDDETGEDNESFERHLSITGGRGGEWRRRRRRTRTRARTGAGTREGADRSPAEGDDGESMSGIIKHSQPREITMEVSDSQIHVPLAEQAGQEAGEARPPSLLPPLSGSGEARNNPSALQRQRDDSELNECPVCGIDIGGESEAEREAHINRCLTDQEFGSPTNAAGGSAVAAKRSKNRMLVYSIPKDADMDHMVINDDNECVICLEEFRPGDKLGRLECLCCFHYRCIKDWIRKKGYCECPIHALHSE